MVAPRLDLLPAQSETPDASPAMLGDKGPPGDDAPSQWLPDLTDGRSTATNLRSHPDC